MTSSRLPGKVLADIRGRPAIARVVDRLRACKLVDEIVIATTANATDDVLVDWAMRNEVAVFRGSEDDVLGRVVGAHEQQRSDIIVEICGDCLLTDPEIVDMGIRTYLENDCDVVSNSHKRSFPMGINVQVFAFAALKFVAETIDDLAVREHVSLYFYENPERYRLVHLLAPERWSLPDCRTQLDYAEDLQFITTIYERLEPQFGGAFGIEEFTALLRREPALREINRHCVERSPR